MRIILIIAWLFVALAGVIFNLGPGHEHAKLDRLDVALNSAQAHVDAQQWTEAIKQFDLALAGLPAEKAQASRQISFEKAKAQMMDKQLPEARQSLEQILADARNDVTCPKVFVAQVESALASAQYYMTWLMRLEGMSKEEWLPEIESARQHYAHVNQLGKDLSDAALVQRSQEDLEAAVRLSRMDLNELQGLAIPCQCQCKCSGKCKKPGRVKSQKKSTGAGLIEIPEGSGS